MNTDKKSPCPQSLSRMSQGKSESPRERTCKRAAYIIKDINSALRFLHKGVLSLMTLKLKIILIQGNEMELLSVREETMISHQKLS